MSKVNNSSHYKQKIYQGDIDKDIRQQKLSLAISWLPMVFGGVMGGIITIVTSIYSPILYAIWQIVCVAFVIYGVYSSRHGRTAP